MRSSSLSPLLAQSLHEQPSQNLLNLKQSQYSFKHFDLLHPHDMGFDVETDARATAAAGDRKTCDAVPSRSLSLSLSLSLSFSAFLSFASFGALSSLAIFITHNKMKDL